MTLHPIHEKILDFIAGGRVHDFEALALEAFAHQFDSIPAYRRACERRGKRPGDVRSWQDIPAVPTLAFKEVDLACAPPERTFVTSGTSAGAQQRGRHAVPDLRLYHAAAVAGMKEFLFPDVDRVRVVSLIPSAHDRPESSLAQMATWAVEEFGGPGSGFFASADKLDFTGVADALRQSESDAEPLCLLTTTGVLIRFLDHAAAQSWSFRLPHGSRLMDTGGTKGAPRPMSRKGVRQGVWNTLAIPGYLCVNEYGMTELLSQYYDNVVRDRFRGRFARRALAAPRWLRPLIIDPETMRPRPPGQEGLLCHVDLANVGSAVSVLTEDVGVLTPDGLQLRGRAAGAEARGCSLALSEFVQA
jgi:hypothetical protein